MKKAFAHKLIIIITLVCMPATASSQGSYIFERMWPALSLSWNVLIPNGIAFDKSGNLYVADSRTHRIVKLTQDGFYITWWGGEGDDEGKFNSPVGVAVDNEGNVYVTDQDNHRVQKFDSEGHHLKTWGSYCDFETGDGCVDPDGGGPLGLGDGQFNVPNGITVDSEGNVYVADVLNDRVQKFTSNGDYLLTFEGDLDDPHDVAIDSRNYVYVADKENFRVLIYNLDGGYEDELDSCHGFFSFPSDLAIDDQDNIYVLEQGYDNIQKFDSNGQCEIEWWNGTFNELNSIAIDKNGYLYATEYLYGTDTGSIQKFTANGDFIIKWSSSGNNSGEFNRPQGVAMDTDGFVYVADSENCRIQKFTQDGQYDNQWMVQECDDAQPRGIGGIATDAANNVFVVDLVYPPFIKKFTPGGDLLCEWGEYGGEGGQFERPYAIAVDGSGNVFVTDVDSTTTRIQKFTPTPDGNHCTDGSGYEPAGWWGGYYYGPDPGDYQFRSPNGIAVDDGGSVYITDANLNPRVLKYSPTENGTGGENGSGYVFDTQWGGLGDDRGEFAWPWALAVDSENSVYVTDALNPRIQKFTPTADGTGIDDSGYAFDSEWGNTGSWKEGRTEPPRVAVYPGQFERPVGIAVSENGDRVFVTDDYTNRVQVFRRFEAPSRAKAIIVAGGGPYAGNSLWDATQTTANFAYRTLLNRGFTKNDIYYLTSDTDVDIDGNNTFIERYGLRVSDDVYAIPTNTSLRQAITDAAHDGAASLVLYLTDHGNDQDGGTFYLNEQHEPLKARDLASWLETVEGVITGEIVVVYDGCQSGSFIDDLIGENRIIVTSARWYEQAKFLNQGTISFSSFFWTNIFNRFSVGDAYEGATQAINFYFSNQNPQLTGSADDVYIDFLQGDSQAPMTEGAPTIESVSSVPSSIEAAVNSDASADINAFSVTDPDGISRVWAEIRPPGRNLGLVSEPLIGQLDTIELTRSPEEDYYKGTFDRFEENGLYQIAIYAMDGKGNISPPHLTTVSLNDHVIRKAIIIAGDDNEVEGPAKDMIEANACLACNALISQEYSENDICLLSVSSIPCIHEEVPVFEPTIASLQACIDSYVQSGTGTEFLDLVIYVTGEGNPGTVTLNDSGEILYASELAVLLKSLQTQRDCRVTLIYDGNHSGSFIPVLAPPPGMERILITSSGENEEAYFNEEGNISFSHFFWGQASIGATIYTSFAYAKNAIAYFNRREEISFSCYREDGPRLETNGESPPNETADYAIARECSIGKGEVSADDNQHPPTIGSAWVEEIRDSEEVVTDVVVVAKDIVCYRGEIEKVWAVIKPVSYCPGAPGEQDAEEPQEFELSVTDGDGQYQSLPISYDSLPGTYKILVYARARDENRTISVSSPRETRFYRVEGDDFYEDDDVKSEANVIVVNHPTPQPHNFYRAGDVDWVKFYAITTYSNPQTNEPVPYTYRIKAGNLGENCKPVIELYHEDNLIEATADDILEVGNEVVLTKELDEWGDGMYYVKIRNLHDPEYPYTGEHTDYELQVDNEDAGGLLVLITGKVRNQRSREGIDGALVKTNGGGSAISVGGSYDLYQKPGPWNLTATHNKYNSFTKSITVNTGGGFMPLDISMLPRTTAAQGECSEDTDCDDGLFCNGNESCVDDACLEGSNPCPAPLTCDEENDLCNGCERDADCDDGLFCNGVETCVDGDCRDGTGSCPEGVTCDEENDACKLASVLVSPGSLFQSRWLPLFVFLRVQGTDTHFGAATEVTFSPDSVRALPMVANQETMFCLGLLMPSWITGPTGDSITVTIKTGAEELSGTVEISMLPFMLNKQE